MLELTSEPKPLYRWALLIARFFTCSEGFGIPFCLFEENAYRKIRQLARIDWREADNIERHRKPRVGGEGSILGFIDKPYRDESWEILKDKKPHSLLCF